MLVSEDQLVGRTPEQLIATILQIQSQHQQYVATISAQYNSITQQLDDLRGSLAAIYSAQASQYQNAASVRLTLSLTICPSSSLRTSWLLLVGLLRLCPY